MPRRVRPESPDEVLHRVRHGEVTCAQATVDLLVALVRHAESAERRLAALERLARKADRGGK